MPSTTATTPAANRSQDDQAIRGVVARMSEVWNHGDLAGYFGLYANDPQMTLVFADRITTGWQQNLDMFKSLWPTRVAMGVFSARDVTVRFLADDLAIVTGIYEHQFPKELVVGAFSLTMRKQAADWKIVHEHTSRRT